ncbi:hypothetical protein K440DRAFT_653406 [Wilcoxina mikolae CBS 423.85]|nr:hypothetical protein K440DRAFT_653406 [Wilcoxina mikolae CBS 423.85]
MDMQVPVGPDPPNYGTLRLSGIGMTYIAVAVIFSALVAAGMAVLLRHRNLPFIRLRKVPLIILALVLLHLQLVFDLLVYPLNGALPCSAEYWIMAVCLPAGVAAFQINNWVLFSRVWGQKHLLSLYTRSKGALAEDRAKDVALHGSFAQRQWYKWAQLCILKKMYILVAVGTAILFVISLVIFLISRRFHASFGLVGAKATAFQCHFGWEWFPSSIWQAIWTYGVGPFILFKIRKIRDTHHWRLQTTLVILFSLPALPLWLSTWFTPDFYNMNTYWPPNLWFVPGLAAMEITILIFPLMEIYSFKKQQRKAKEEPGHTKFSKYSVAALDCALRGHGIHRLEEFAVNKDLSGENILFLKGVGSWKSKWQAAQNNGTPSGLEFAIKRELYDEAESIWKRLIDRDSAKFPLNIDDSIYRCLERVFGASYPCGMRTGSDLSSHIVPFADDITPLTEKALEAGLHEVKTKKLPGLSMFAGKSSQSPSEPCITPPGMGFCGEVFDRAEASVRQMVLENTWVRYVDSLPEEERRNIGVGHTISPPVSGKWKGAFWKKDG